MRKTNTIERKKGEWLAENITQGGEHGNQYMAKSTTSTLADIGISKDESSKAQRIAKQECQNCKLLQEEIKKRDLFIADQREQIKTLTEELVSEGEEDDDDDEYC